MILHFLYSRSKTNFFKFSFVIDDRFDRKISEPTANNLSTASKLEIAVLNLLNFYNHASLCRQENNLGGGGGGTIRPLPWDGGAEELRGDPTVGPHPKVWTIDRE